jgi:pimeloyl-ACP methyl ester carboxylesterase
MKIYTTLFSIFIFRIANGQSLGFLGCVTTTPECPNENVTFYFYTRETAENPKLLSLTQPETFTSANFIVDRPLIILIHGYTGDHDYSPNSHIRPAFFERDEFNIVSIDYKPLAKYPCYLSAVRNIQTVSNCTAQFIDYIIDNEIFSLESIHVIGFSLGAQVI